MSNGEIVVREVISSTADGANLMGSLPGLVRQLLDEEAWRDFTAPNPVGPVHNDTFSEFVAKDPPGGLGGRRAQLLALCGTDEELVKRVKRLLDEDVEPAREHRGSTVTERTNRDDTANSSCANGDNTEYLMSRLKRDDPELAQQVVNGEMSTYAAARSKGWKKPRIVVSSPTRVADSLRKHMTPEQLAELADLLQERK